jgi:chemotaxis protein CheX
MLAQELVQIMETVWTTTLGEDISPVPKAASPETLGACLTATIYFKGAWPGLLTVTCGMPLSQRIAASMFQLPVEAVSMEDVRDAVGEVVNILGGNLKAILPPPCMLSLPAVFDGDFSDLVVSPGDSGSVDELWFESHGEHMLLRLVTDQAAADAQGVVARP